MNLQSTEDNEPEATDRSVKNITAAIYEIYFRPMLSWNSSTMVLP